MCADENEKTIKIHFIFMSRRYNKFPHRLPATIVLWRPPERADLLARFHSEGENKILRDIKVQLKVNLTADIGNILVLARDL